MTERRITLTASQMWGIVYRQVIAIHERFGTAAEGFPIHLPLSLQDALLADIIAAADLPKDADPDVASFRYHGHPIVWDADSHVVPVADS